MNLTRPRPGCFLCHSLPVNQWICPLSSVSRYEDKVYQNLYKQGQDGIYTPYSKIFEHPLPVTVPRIRIDPYMFIGIDLRLLPMRNQKDQWNKNPMHTMEPCPLRTVFGTVRGL